MFKPVIGSLLDTDLYKFTMWQPFLHFFPANHAVYEFVCRNDPEYPLAELRADLEAQLEHLFSLSFTEDELAYLSTKRFLKSDFIDFLRIFRFQKRYIEVTTAGEALKVVAAGPQIHVMGFEIFVLAIVNELYFRRFASDAVLEEGRRRLREKIRTIGEIDNSKHRTPFHFFDFGTRRRFSRAWHEELVSTLSKEASACFRGTSNVYLAMKFGIAAIGTMAHEYLQTFQAVGVQLRQFQKAGLEHWVQEYRGDLGVALTDVVGMNAFLRDFDLYFAKLFDGLRHDSGDPIEWGEKAIAHYEALRILPMTKRLVFSDSLDLPKAVRIWEHFADRVPVGFGIGTNLTNDLGVQPLNIVMKLTHCNRQPVAKLSDSPGKALSSDPTFIAYLRQVFNQRI
ncbi:MAG TPA: nicotinate phosphoribosyltransferase [Steroidobacteraceae bacterium]|nr:nicotinate phosphoribosyltransferase [Steroidobacteraceae bacterium]